MKIESSTCGCCTNGCVCTNHMDIPNGVRPGPCAAHAALPFAPLDRTYRWDTSIQNYVRVPLGETR